MQATENDRHVVLAVGAHPDDVEITCAGTLGLVQKAGFAVHVATMTLGDCGSKEFGAEEIRATRHNEAETACRELGAVYHYVGFHDFEIFNNDVSNRRVTALIRAVKPTLVLTHQPNDYIYDHEVTSLLVRNACFYAPAANYDTFVFSTATAMDQIPHLYYWDVLEGVDVFGKSVVPQFYVDISGQINQKTSMLSHHKSQREWLRAQHGVDEYLDAMREWSRLRGGQATQIAGRPVAFAEAFRQHLGHAYPHTNLLADILHAAAISNPTY